ncbi:MAG: NAD-dependent epimerase/dehydratase family protein [Ferruginibacter sp.]
MILVTGGAGLLGGELIRQLLLQGCEVRAIYNKTPLPDFGLENLQQFQCNILDIIGLEEAMQDVDLVYHCAAIVTFDPARRSELFQVNVEGTANVVNAALNAGVKKLLHVSSVAALGRIREDKAVNESMVWTEETSNSIYGESKYRGEMEVWRGIGEGLEAVIVNPSIILGAGDWSTGSSQLFKNVYDEFPWFTEGTTGFVDARDVAKAMIKLMESAIINERFIISAENVSYQELFNLIAKTFHKKQPYKKVTPMIARVVWRWEAIKTLFTKKKPLITKETTATALAKVHYNNKKLLRFLPDFQYRSIEETIQHTCAALRQNLSINEPV